MTGNLAKTNPFRFSTKYQDDETDLVYYGYRYYNASTGRWLSRDPIGEREGLNVYGFVNNDPSNTIDFHGLLPKRIRLHIAIDEGDFTSHVGGAMAGGDLKIFYRPWADPQSAGYFNLERAKSDLEQALGSSCIEKLTIGGHGAAIAYDGSVVSTTMLADYGQPNVKNSSILEFLKFVSSKMCPDERLVDIWACKVADDRSGLLFIMRLAKFMDSPVSAYDQNYGPWAHGTEWRAAPDTPQYQWRNGCLMTAPLRSFRWTEGGGLEHGGGA